MDLSKVSPGRREVLERIAQYERERRFDEDVENDPPAPVLLPDKVDYLTKKPINKFLRRIANRAGDRFFGKLVKKGIIETEAVEGREYLSALGGGAVITCNHFSAYDNYILFNAIRGSLRKQRLYKVIREGNFTNFPGLYGFLFRHCDTLPLSSHPRTMINFLSAVDTLLKRGETVLVYPEQGMWWNYRKPRPLKPGAFRMAVRAGVPVLPTLITMRDAEDLDENGYPRQIYSLHILPPIYPDTSLSEKAAAEKMKEENYRLWKEKYEEVYGIALDYGPGVETKPADAAKAGKVSGTDAAETEKAGSGETPAGKEPEPVSGNPIGGGTEEREA